MRFEGGVLKTGRFFLVAISFLAVSLLIFSAPVIAAEAGRPAYANAGDQWDRTTMVEGHIEDVNFSSQALRVNGRYYYFTGVPIVNESGQISSSNQLISGRMVKLYFRGNVLDKIIVFEHPVIQ